MRTRSLLVADVVTGACSGGKQTADGGAPDASAGSVTFHLVVPSTETFCDEITCATGVAQHLRISTSGGQPLVLQQGGKLHGILFQRERLLVPMPQRNLRRLTRVRRDRGGPILVRWLPGAVGVRRVLLARATDGG